MKEGIITLKYYNLEWHRRFNAVYYGSDMIRDGKYDYSINIYNGVVCPGLEIAKHFTGGKFTHGLVRFYIASSFEFYKYLMKMISKRSLTPGWLGNFSDIFKKYSHYDFRIDHNIILEQFFMGGINL